MISLALGKPFLEFPVEVFVEKVTDSLIEVMERQKSRGVIFGASGGVDSLVSAALCLKSREKINMWRVVGLQMNDRRVKGESYNQEIYRGLGVDLIEKDITSEAISHEKQTKMPPRWLTICLMKFILKYTPIKARRSLILAIKDEKASKCVLIHFLRLTLLHRLRIARLCEYAARNDLMVVICANRTEAMLGYFVEKGIDDPKMGAFAPIAGLYKSQVMRTAQFLGLPERAIHQRPSPGFGGIYDEQIIGPYELVDPVLIGLQLGYSDIQIAQAICPYGKKRNKKIAFRRKNPFGIQYVGFIRKLVELNLRKK